MTEPNETAPVRKYSWQLFIAIFIGAVLPLYVGYLWLFPLLPTVMFWWGGKSFLPQSRHFFIPSIAFQAGQLIWYVTASMHARLLTPADILEAAIVCGLVIWLLLKPGLLPAILVGIIQLLSLAMNVVALNGTALGSIPHKALVVTVLWRIMALFLLWEGYYLLKRTYKSSNPTNMV